MGHRCALAATEQPLNDRISVCDSQSPLRRGPPAGKGGPDVEAHGEASRGPCARGPPVKAMPDASAIKTVARWRAAPLVCAPLFGVRVFMSSAVGPLWRPSRTLFSSSTGSRFLTCP